MGRKKTGFTVEQHLEMAADLYKICELLRSATLRFSPAYPIALADRVNAISQRVGKVRSDLDSWFLIEHGGGPDPRYPGKHSPYFGGAKPVQL